MVRVWNGWVEKSGHSWGEAGGGGLVDSGSGGWEVGSEGLAGGVWNVVVSSVCVGEGSRGSSVSFGWSSGEAPCAVVVSCSVALRFARAAAQGRIGFGEKVLWPQPRKMYSR